jgi:predicted nucleic acid-binding protein
MKVVTCDTNIAVYANLDEEKTVKAVEAVRESEFFSIQVLNEFANVFSRKYARPWTEVSEAVEDLRQSVATVLPIDELAHREAMRIADRYRLSFYDALMLAVALKGGARTIYSEDLHHGLVIDDTLRIIDPFR